MYDDIDGAFVVELFKESDTGCFYVLSEFKKIITANVVMLAVIFSVIVSAVAVMNILWSSAIDFHSFFRLADNKFVPDNFELFGVRFELDGKDFFNKLVFGLLSCLFGYFLMSLFYHTEYKHFQNNNIREMYTFLVRYLADINSNFRKVQNEATRAVVEEQDADQVKRDIVLWVTNMQWMAFRAFFIEYFLMNINFQILRNSMYSLWLVPLFFAAALFGTAYAFNIPEFNVFDLRSSLYHQNSFYLLFGLLLLAYYRYLRKALPSISHSVEGEWFGFRELNILSAMTMIMESYANQLDQWRARFRDRSGGPSV